MSGLFISYRREDTAPYAGRIYDYLHRAFPDAKVFMDIDAINPGEDFVDAINKTLAASSIVIAVIGPSWMKVTDVTGRRRIDHPDDYVVREICAALESNTRVIPVLVGGATMPRSDSLPPRLQPLARRHAIEISDTRFVTDAERLSAAISRIIDPTDHERHGAGAIASMPTSLADSLTTFKTLLWTDYALGFVAALIQLGRARDGQAMSLLIFFIVLYGLGAWFNIMLIRGRNWARMAFIALFALAVPSAFMRWAEQSGAEIALNVVSLIISIWLLRMMFTEPLRKSFVRRT